MKQTIAFYYKTYVVLVVFLSLTTVLFGQTTTIPIQLQEYLKHIKPTDEIQFFVEGNVSEIASFVVKHGGTTGTKIGNYIAVTLPASEVATLAWQPMVKSIPFEIKKPQTFNDSMLIHNNITPVHAGSSPLITPYTGKHVVMGIIDSGIELTHPDFEDSTGNTRVIALWDQTYPIAGNTPQPYNYGQQWDSTDINAGNCPHIDPPTVYGHGTSVIGTAASNGLAAGNFIGAAPDADLVVVANDLWSNNWPQTLADAVSWIYHIADSLNEPCVINLSLGTYAGSHDGKDPVTLFVDSLITAKGGRALVAAAGNAGQIPYHLGYTVTADTSFTWFNYSTNIMGLGTGGVYLEAWADTADFNNVNYAVAADMTMPYYDRRGVTSFHNVTDNLGSNLSDTIKNGTNILGIVQYNLQLTGDRYRLEVFIDQPDSINYEFAFMTTGAGKFDCWAPQWEGYSQIYNSALPAVGAFAPIAYYKTSDTLLTIVDMLQCSPNVITVGNYQNRESYVDYNLNLQPVAGITGSIVNNSSTGPTRTNLLKPDICASGYYTLTSLTFDLLAWQIVNEPFKVTPDGLHGRAAGTSIASPVVAGTVALYFEKCPTATNIMVKNAITGNSVQDGFTGTVPNNTWGWGKVDALAALISSNFSVTITANTLCCNGDSTLLSAPAGYSGYTWNTGDTTAQIYAVTNGNYWAFLTDSSGCIGTTDTISVTNTGIEEYNELGISVYPNPADNRVTIAVKNGNNNNQLFLINALGQKVWEGNFSVSNNRKVTIDISQFKPGIYTIVEQSTTGEQGAALLIVQ